MDPASLIREWFHEVWDEGREEAIDRLLAPHTVMHGLAGDMVGPEPFKKYFRTMRAAFGDLEVKVIRTVVEGDTVAAHCRVVARHVGETLGGPATNRPVEFYGMAIVRAENGKLVEGWNCFDFLSMYQQLGWVPDPVLPA